MASSTATGEVVSVRPAGFQSVDPLKPTRSVEFGEVNLEELLERQEKGLQKILSEFGRRKRVSMRLEAEVAQLQGENHRLRVELSKCIPPEGSACGSGETGGTSELVLRPRGLLQSSGTTTADLETFGGIRWDSVSPPLQEPPRMAPSGDYPPRNVSNNFMEFSETLPGTIGDGEYSRSVTYESDTLQDMEKRVPVPLPTAFASSPVEPAPLFPVVPAPERKESSPISKHSASIPRPNPSPGRVSRRVSRIHCIKRDSELLAELVSDRKKISVKSGSIRGSRASDELQDVRAPFPSQGSGGLKGGKVAAIEDKPKGELKAVFADATAMKERLRLNLCKKKYNVADFYKQTGWAQAIARKPLFDNITLAVIALNAGWIMVDTDHNHADLLLEADPVFVVMENFFCSYFFFEWVVRFCSFKYKRDGLKDGWFVFDSILVFMMVGETWVLNSVVWMIGGGGSGNPIGNASILRLFRLLRLSRMARMARLLRAMPELMVLIKGMATAMRSVFFTLCLLLGIIYVFGIAFVQLMRDTEPGDQYFKDVPSAMNSLLLQGTIPDQAEIVETIGVEHWIYRAFILFYILLASLTVMNMLVGVLCEVVTVVSTVEKESLLVNYVKTQLENMLKTSGLDANADGMIAKKEFEALLENPRAAQALQEVGVDVIGLVDFTDFIFSGGRLLSFQDFMDTVLSLRGSNTATVKDVVDLRKFMVTEFEKVVSKFSTLGNLIAGEIREDEEDFPDSPESERQEVMMISRNTLGNRGR